MKNLRLNQLHFPGILLLVFALSYLYVEDDKQQQSASLLNLSSSYETQNLPTYAEKGIDYLIEVQFENGGWGAGTHANQQMIDPTKVQVDPATTAFASMALLRSGNTLTKGKYHENLQKSLNLLLDIVEKAPEEGLSITGVTGTQPQIKLGQNVDATMCVQFFIRILSHTENNKKLHSRVTAAIDKCLHKIQKSQASDGSIQGGGWAPVLQSAMANNALELAYDAGLDVDQETLEKSREYQKGNMRKDGSVKSERGAGVSLYAVASSQRATAKEARRAKEAIRKAKKNGKVKNDAKITRETLKQTGELSDKDVEYLMGAYEQNQMTIDKMQDDKVIAGFGNNGGEEFLSFMMTSESLIITGGEEWESWEKKMNQMLENIQNTDGSWNGHHCITSPVFCTAACILALTVENDKELLMKEQDKK